jgi:hypothetical protein
MKRKQTVIFDAARHPSFLPVCALLLAAPLLAVSQNAAHSARPTQPLSTAAAQARRDQLAKIPELLADPDPNARTANMEAILNTNDATMIQMALRLAFQSDDANLRSLAMRAYIANLKELTFDILLPDSVERQYEAVQSDPHKTDELFKTFPYMGAIANVGFKVRLTFTRYNSSESTGEVQGYGAPVSFMISGDRLSARVNEAWGGFASFCSFDFRPSNNMTLLGTMNCEPFNGARVPRLAISAPIF